MDSKIWLYISSILEGFVTKNNSKERGDFTDSHPQYLLILTIYCLFLNESSFFSGEDK